jgi:hypothetical protein
MGTQNRSACSYGTVLTELSLLQHFRQFPLKFLALYLQVLCLTKRKSCDTLQQVNNYSTVHSLVSPGSLFTNLQRQKRHLYRSCSEFPLRHINLRLAGLFMTSLSEQVGHTPNPTSQSGAVGIYLNEWRIW